MNLSSHKRSQLIARPTAETCIQADALELLPTNFAVPCTTKGQPKTLSVGGSAVALIVLETFLMTTFLFTGIALLT